MKRLKTNRVVLHVLLVAMILAVSGFAAMEVTKYNVHQEDRPRPPVVTPPQQFGQPPSDAIVLFDGKNLDKWQKGNQAPTWEINEEEGYARVRGGSIQTRDQFGSCQLHVEWRIPEGIPANKKGQSRSNSGVFLMDRYEVQVLDSYTDDDYKTNSTYADGQAGAIYGSHPPMVNACRPAGQWQTYDIAFMKPLFDESGKCIRKAMITLYHNGVCVHNNLPIEGTTFHKQKARYEGAHEKGHIQLQDHGNPICFRNIWIRELPEEPYLIK